MTDERPLAFFRIVFGALMMVYSAGKCSDDHLVNRDIGQSFYSFNKRVIPQVYDFFVVKFPWFTRQDLYWKFHAPLMLLCAVGMTLGFGLLSRASCLGFFLLKMALTLQTQHTFNNHEYLYALIPLALSFLRGHDVHYSVAGKAAGEAMISASPSPSPSSSPSPSVSARVALTMLLAGTSYMMVHNAVYGIAGHVAVVGMCVFVWPAAIILLGSADTSSGNSNSSTCTIPPRYRENALQSWFLPIFFGLVYLYAGIAKTGEDWLSGRTAKELVRLWTGPTAPSALRTLVLSYHGNVTEKQPLLLNIMVWGGLLLDISAGVGLNCGIPAVKATLALLLVAFHLSNHYFFVIETFPWVMITALVVNFDSQWMDTVKRMLCRLCTARPIIASATAYRIVRRVGACMALVMAASLLLWHVAAPLPCAVHSLWEDGSLSWGSQCQYWSWRMMTRSTRALPVGLLIRNQSSEHTWTKDVGLRGAWQEAAPYEDRLLAMLQAYRGPQSDLNAMVTTTTTTITPAASAAASTMPSAAGTGEEGRRCASSEVVYADVWVEVNGPPFQRYVHPKVNLARQSIGSSSSNSGETTAASTLQAYVTALVSGPQPLATWVMPRILSVRTRQWQDRFAAIQRHVHTVHRGSACSEDGGRVCGDSGSNDIPEGVTNSSPEVVFLADISDSRPMQVSSTVAGMPEESSQRRLCNRRHSFEMQLLSGRAQVLNLDTALVVEPGACLRFEGEIVVRALGEEPALWSLVMDSSSSKSSGGTGTSTAQSCALSYKYLRVSGALEGASMPAPARLHLAHGPEQQEQGGGGGYPPAFRYCMELQTIM